MSTPLAAFSLQLLGPPSLAAPDGAPVRLRTRKQLALVARLAWDAPRALSRDYLIDFLWRSAEPRAARHSLAQALSAIRKVFGDDALVTARGTVALRAGLVSVDVRAPGALEGALLGRPFEGFDIPDAPAFDQWRDQVVAETWPVLRDAMVQAIARARSVGQYMQVEALGRELLARDALCEEGIAACVEGRALAGDRVGALRIYDDYASLLARELDTQPSDGLRRAAANLRRGVEPRAEHVLRVTDAATGARAAFKPVPLVGRERSYAALHAHWVSAHDGEPRYVVIGGAPGVGKTALGMMLAAGAHAAGSAVVRLQLHDTECTAPYALLAEVVRQLLGYPGAGATAGESLAELSRICPAVRMRFSGVSEAPAAVPETVHLRLTEALVALIASVTEEQPVLLLLDDIVLGDDASLVVLRRLPRKLGDRRLLMCYTSSTPDLRTVFAEPDDRSMREESRWIRLTLEPLTEPQARELVERRLGDVPATRRGDLVNRVVGLGRGNPLALEMLLRDWRSYGSDSLVFRADAMTGADLDPSRIPDRIRQAFERQRAMLSESAREILDLAAVLGHRLLDLDVYAALGASPLRVTEAARQLLAAGIWSDAGVELEFRNEFLRFHAYLTIPRPARVALHARVARVLEERLREDDATQLLELAWHLWRAGVRDRAAAEALKGVERCLRTFAPRTAERVATDFLAEQISEVQRSRFSYVLGRALAMQSRLRAAEEPLRAAMDDENLSDVAQTEARLLLGEVLVKNLSAARTREVLALAHSSLVGGRRLGNVPLQARAYRLLAEVLVDLDRDDELQAAKQQLEVLVDSDGAAYGEIQIALGYINAHQHGLEEARTHFSRAVATFSERGDWQQLANAWNGMGIVHHGLGQWADAHESFLEGITCTKRFDDVRRQAKILSNLAAVDIVTADYERAIRTLELAIELMQQSENARHEVVVHINRLQARLGNGDVYEAAAIGQTVRGMVLEDSHWEVKLATNLALADYHLAVGESGRALALIEESARLAEGRERRILEPAQFLRLEVLRQVQLLGPTEARDWLLRVGNSLATGQVVTRLVFNALAAWVDSLIHIGARARFAAAMEAIAGAGAYGLLDELRWSGVGGGLGKER